MDFRDILTKKMEAQGTPVSNQGTPASQIRQAGMPKRTVRQNEKPMCSMAHPAYLPYLFRGMVI